MRPGMLPPSTRPAYSLNGGATRWKRAGVVSAPILPEALVAASALILILVAQWLLSRWVPGTNYYGLDGKLAQSAART